MSWTFFSDPPIIPTVINYPYQPIQAHSFPPAKLSLRDRAAETYKNGNFQFWDSKAKLFGSSRKTDKDSQTDERTQPRPRLIEWMVEKLRSMIHRGHVEGVKPTTGDRTVSGWHSQIRLWLWIKVTTKRGTVLSKRLEDLKRGLKLRLMCKLIEEEEGWTCWVYIWHFCLQLCHVEDTKCLQHCFWFGDIQIEGQNVEDIYVLI